MGQKILDALNWCKTNNAKIDFDPTGDAPVMVSLLILEAEDPIGNIDNVTSHKVLTGLGQTFPDAVGQCSKALESWEKRRGLN